MSLLSVAMWASILAMACVRRPVEQRRVHGIDRVDEGVGLLDESVGTGADRISCIRLRAGPAWASLSSSSRLSWKAVVRLAELLPGRLLVVVEVFQVVKLVGQIEQVVLQRVEPLDELLALLVGQQRVDERQPVA